MLHEITMSYKTRLLVCWEISPRMPDCFSHVQLFCDTIDWMKPARLLSLWDSPSKNTGVGCHALLQGIFRTHELNRHLLHLLHRQVGSLLLVTPGKLPRVAVYLWSLPLGSFPRHLASSKLSWGAQLSLHKARTSGFVLPNVYAL